MIGRLHSLRARRGHPRPALFSQYLDEDLAPADRAGFESHLRGCRRCRDFLRSLSETVAALGSLGAPVPGVRADSILAAFAEQTASIARVERSGSPHLSIVPSAGDLAGSAPPAGRAAARLRALLVYCLRRAQLRVTVPVAVAVGMVVSVVNQGSMLFDGRIDIGMCAICGLNFVVPFIALNVVLLGTARVSRRRGV